MFLGKHLCALDEKNRLLAPEAIREGLSGELYISRGFDRNLWVLTASAFQEIYRRVTSLNLADPLARLLLRLVLGSASELELNKSGYLSIPVELKEFADLASQALLVGQGDYLEIWSLDLWKQQETDLRNAELNSNRFAGLVIAAR